jgi:hypothetical protein
VSKADQWIIQLNVEPDPTETHKIESNNQLQGDGRSIDLAPFISVDIADLGGDGAYVEVNTTRVAASADPSAGWMRGEWHALERT